MQIRVIFSPGNTSTFNNCHLIDESTDQEFSNSTSGEFGIGSVVENNGAKTAHLFRIQSVLKEGFDTGYILKARYFTMSEGRIQEMNNVDLMKIIRTEGGTVPS